MLTTWLCPICALEEMPYGETCPRLPDCENAARAHITGQYYLKQRGIIQPEVRGIGISEISDESAGESMNKV